MLCTTRRHDAQRTEEGALLYPWHPWFGRRRSFDPTFNVGPLWTIVRPLDGAVGSVTGAGRRRAWTLEQKARIVAESYETGEPLCAVARRYGLTPQQLFGWRGEARRWAACAVAEMSDNQAGADRRGLDSAGAGTITGLSSIFRRPTVDSVCAKSILVPSAC